jgi:hypothetical protein
MYVSIISSSKVLQIASASYFSFAREGMNIFLPHYMSRRAKYVAVAGKILLASHGLGGPMTKVSLSKFGVVSNCLNITIVSKLGRHHYTVH